jgi:hypothetical protein
MMVRERGSGDARPWWTWWRRTEVVGSKPRAEYRCLVTSCGRLVGMRWAREGYVLRGRLVGGQG